MPARPPGLRRAAQLDITSYGRPLVGPSRLSQALFDRVTAAGQGGVTVAELFADAGLDGDAADAWLALGWLMKVGAVEGIDLPAPR